MMESFDSPTTPATISSEPSSQQKRLIRRVIHIGLGGLVTLGVLFGGYNWACQLPEQAYAEIYRSPWLEANVSLYRLKTRQDFDQARQTLLKATQTDGMRENPLPFYLLGELYQTLGDSKKAINAYQQVIRIAKQSWYNQIRYRSFLNEAQSALAICYYENNKLGDAKRILSSIADFDATDKADLLHALQDRLENPERADFHMEVGKAFSRHLKLELAAKEAKVAQRLSQSPQLRLEAALFLKNAIPRGVRDLSPMARYYSLAGEVYQNEESDLIQAATLYEQVVKESPAYEWGYNDLAIIYRDLKDLNKAEWNARKAIALNPEFYNPYLTLGDLAIDREDYPGAIRQFQTAKQLLQQIPVNENDTILANIENQIAYSYESQGDLPQAIRHYNEALRIASELDDENPMDYDYAQQGLARIKAITGNGHAL